MSTTTPTTTTIRQRVDDLIDYVNNGKIIEALDEFYDDRVEMRENSEPPTVGKEANRERENRFLASVKDWKWTRWHSVAVNEDDGVAALEYSFQFVNTDGETVTYEQASIQRWKDGKIVSERFYHP